MRSYEKQLDLANEGNSESDDCSEHSETDETEHVAKRTAQQESEIFKDFYELISRKTIETAHCNDDEALGNLIQQLSNDVGKLME